MCGITGFLSSTLPAHAGGIGARMAKAIQYRGPDDQGVWTDAEAGVLLAHRRLAIVDLSAAGHQPMASPSGRFMMVFNGEVYNHLALRESLAAEGRAPASWRGHSDTETLLAAMDAWGIEATLQQASGMFAMAIWDRQDRRLTLTRDRFGEKPLYYGWVGQGGTQHFLFGSDLHALRAHPQGPSALSREALGLYMRFLCVPAPWSIFEGIFKLEPGCMLEVTPGASPVKQPPRAGQSGTGWTLKRWWSFAGLVESAAHAPFTRDEDALDALDDALSNAVRGQSNADVPLGAFLSGGVDSSLIVAMMCKHATQPVRTFTIGFEDFGTDETPHAAAVAKHLGTLHTAQVYSAQDVLEAIPRMASIYSEPFADASQVPTFMVCQAARLHVTVALSGDAGDELFGGYNRYFWGPRFWNRLAWMPEVARRGLGSVLQAVPAAGWDTLAAPMMATLRRRVWGGAGAAGVGDKLHRLGHRLQTVQCEDDLYLSLVSEWQAPQEVVGGDIGLASARRPAELLGTLPVAGLQTSPMGMLYRDTMGYLPDDILCKVDRAAMAVSLETRAPFLDPHVADVAWRMPAHMKLRAGQGKWALKQVLDRYVPREIIERPKSGFGVPIGQWLRGPLRPWAEALLSTEQLGRSRLLNVAPVRARWQAHLSGQHDHTGSLWAVLMFQSWLYQQGL